MNCRQAIETGNTTLGIELGSTRIKAVLLGADFTPLASGGYTWENRYENGYWTYPLEQAEEGVRACYRELKENVARQYGVTLTTVGAIGVSGMMHGYLAFDVAGKLLTPFRTWRNTTTEAASEELSALFGFHIPQRWSVAHLRQAMRNGEAHVSRISSLMTLAGYIHYRLTGERIVGLDEGSGMFPIDEKTLDYNEEMLAKFDALAADYPWRLRELLPKVQPAGTVAGRLTPAGAALLDPQGDLQPGIPLCPPEGDGGTGMAATNSVAAGTGNVSAGTSIFAMVVLEKPLSRVYPELDIIMTPAGKPVAMVHCNNGTSDTNAWVDLFAELLKLMGHEADMGELYTRLYHKSLEGATDCGGVTVYNYFSGEHLTGFETGRPMVVRNPEMPFPLADFFRAQLYSTMATLALGLDILKQEQVPLRRLIGHGGLFKTPGVGQKYLAAATNTPVWVMETAGEGGPYGMALLAAYLREPEGERLEDFLENKVFARTKGSVLEPEAEDAAGFQAYLKRFADGLAVERAATERL